MEDLSRVSLIDLTYSLVNTDILTAPQLNTINQHGRRSRHYPIWGDSRPISEPIRGEGKKCNTATGKCGLHVTRRTWERAKLVRINT